MNIFYTNKVPSKAAFEHCTVHTRKMIVEYCQLMATAKRVLDGQLITCWVKEPDRDREIVWHAIQGDEFSYIGGKRYLVGHQLYKNTHENHPCAKWVRESEQHYAWLWMCAHNLCLMYERQSGKEHKSYQQLVLLSTPPDNLPNNGFTQPPQAMPEEFHNHDATIAYQNYLCAKFSEWQTRDKPIDVDFYMQKPEWY